MMVKTENKAEKGIAGIQCGELTTGAQTIYIDSNAGCRLLYCLCGRAMTASHFTTRTVLHPGAVVMLFSDTEFAISRTSPDFKCLSISIEDESVTDIFYKINSADFWDYLYRHPVLLPPHDVRMLAEGWFRSTCWIIHNMDGDLCRRMVRNNLENLFAAAQKLIMELPESGGAGAKSAAWQLVDRMFALMLRHVGEERSVQYYASELCISPDYLNRICRQVIGESTKSIISSMVLNRMKILLTDTSLSVAEIAQRLNYDNVPYMCRFFRKSTGCSMIEFREKNRRASER